MIPQHGTRGQKPIAVADNGRLGAVKFWLTKSSQHQFNRDGIPAAANETVGAGGGSANEAARVGPTDSGQLMSRDQAQMLLSAYSCRKVPPDEGFMKRG